MTKKQTVQIAEAKGRPMLHWVGKRAKPHELISSPERDFALFDTGVQCCAFRLAAPVEVGEVGRRAAFVCARAIVRL